MSQSQADIDASARLAAKGKKGEILVVSHRSHHHAFDPSDPDVTFISNSKPLTAPRRLLQLCFSAFMIHYFLWIFPMCGTLYFFYSIGWWWVSALMLAMYIPTFVNKDEFKAGRPWHGLRNSSLWRLTSRYIGIEVVRTHKLQAEGKKYMFGVYPHGILILSRVAMYGKTFDSLFPGIETRVLAASPMFYLPGSREICLWMGAVNAAKWVAQKIYSKYNLSLMVYPGGSDEIFVTDPNDPVTRLIVRKGFIKLAIQSGADVVPAHVFGEKWLYNRRPVPAVVHNFFYKRLRTPLIWFWGRYFSWLPFHDQKKRFLSVVFGRPIPVTQTAEPSDEYIEEIWRLYAAQIQALYDEYKTKFGYDENETLLFQEAKASSSSKKHAHSKKDAAKADGAKAESNGSSKKKKAQ